MTIDPETIQTVLGLLITGLGGGLIRLMTQIKKSDERLLAIEIKQAQIEPVQQSIANFGIRLGSLEEHRAVTNSILSAMTSSMQDLHADRQADLSKTEDLFAKLFEAISDLKSDVKVLKSKIDTLDNCRDYHKS